MREAEDRNTALVDEIMQLRQETAALQTEVDELGAKAASYRSELDDREEQLERLNSLASRYKNEIDSHESQLVGARRETRQATLRDLIHQVTPRRLATLMETHDDPQRSYAADRETLKVVEWLVGYLSNCGVMVTHRTGEQLHIAEEDLHAFKLDEEYREGSLFQVISPGFALEGDVLVRSKVRYVEEEGNDGSQGSSPGDTGQEVPGGIEDS